MLNANMYFLVQLPLLGNVILFFCLFLFIVYVVGVIFP